MISSTIYAQENPITENTDLNSLEQRRQAVKNYIRQELEKGISCFEEFKEIHDELKHQSYNTLEYQVYQQATRTKIQLRIELRDNGCLNKKSLSKPQCINTPECKILEQSYINTKKECRKLEKIYKKTPEEIAHQTIKKIYVDKFFAPGRIRDKAEFEKQIRIISQKKQKLEEIIQKSSKKEQELLNSLLQ